MTDLQVKHVSRFVIYFVGQQNRGLVLQVIYFKIICHLFGQIRKHGGKYAKTKYLNILIYGRP